MALTRRQRWFRYALAALAWLITPDGRWVTMWVIAADGRYLSMQYRADLTTVPGGRRLIADDIRALAGCRGVRNTGRRG